MVSTEGSGSSGPSVFQATDFLESKFIVSQEPLINIALISGSPLFLPAVLPLLRAGLPLVIHCKQRSRRDPLPSEFGITWTQISHARVGWVTNQRIWLGLQTVEGWASAPQVSRRIGHTISHSKRPEQCQKDAMFPHRTIRDALEQGKLTLPVMHPSKFSHAGFGQ